MENHLESFIEKGMYVVAFELKIQKEDKVVVNLGLGLCSSSVGSCLFEQIHVVFKDKPFGTVLGGCLEMHNELWTGGKVMYMLEQVVGLSFIPPIFRRFPEPGSPVWKK